MAKFHRILSSQHTHAQTLCLRLSIVSIPRAGLFRTFAIRTEQQEKNRGGDIICLGGGAPAQYSRVYVQFLVSSGVAKPEGEKSGRGERGSPSPLLPLTDNGELSRLSVAGVLEFLVKAGRSPHGEHGVRRDAELWPGDNTLASHATEVGSYSPQCSRVPPLADCKNRQIRATDIRAVGSQRNN